MGLKYRKQRRLLPFSDRSGPDHETPFCLANMILDKTAVLISQTGGGCRASNYIGFIRRALEKAGHASRFLSSPST